MTAREASRIRVCLLGALSIAVPLLEWADTGGALRAVLAIAFHLTIPGVPLIALLRLDSTMLVACVGGALSIGLTIVSAQLMLWADWWSPAAPVVVFSLVSLSALAGDLWRSRLRPSAARPSRTG